MRTTHSILFLLLVLSMMSSCVKYKSLVNFTESPRIPIGTPQVIDNLKPITIQSNDILQIKVSSLNAAAIQPFSISGSGDQQGSAFDEYLVDSDGNIDFPTIGKVELRGLEIEEAKNKLFDLLAPYFEQDPILQIRLTNFRVNVNGEVGSPGTFSVNNGRVTIIEAMTMAGDFTSYSRRDSILIIREQNGMRSFGYVDFNSAEVFTSPYFYLQQNDVVYVQPEKTIVNSVRDPATRILPWISAFISITALMITVTR